MTRWTSSLLRSGMAKKIAFGHVADEDSRDGRRPATTAVSPHCRCKEAGRTYSTTLGHHPPPEPHPKGLDW